MKREKAILYTISLFSFLFFLQSAYAITCFNSGIYEMDSPSNATYTQNWVWANVTLLANTGGGANVSLNGTANQTMARLPDTRAYYINLSIASEGANNVIFYCNDTGGIWYNSSTRYFTNDWTKPRIDLQSPTNTTHTTASIWFNITGSEILNWSAYSLDGAANVSLANTTGKWWGQNSSMAQGSHNVTFYFNDTVGNMNSTIVYFIVDSIVPILTIQSPVTAFYGFTTNTLWFNITANELLNWSGYSIDGGANVTMTNSSGNWNNFSNSVADGTHTVIFYANDSAGQIGTVSRDFIIDVTPPVYNNYSINSTNIRKNDTILISAYWSDATSSLYQYVFSWNNSGSWVNDTAVSFGYGNQWSNITKQVTTNKAQTISYKIYAFDFAGYPSVANVNVTEEYNITVNNSAPIVTASIFPSPANSSNDLNCTYTYSDIDNDTESSRWFLWYINGALDDDTTQNISSGNFSGTENVICSIRAFDGTDNSTWVNSSEVTLGDNTPPSIYNDFLSASSGYTNTVLNIYTNLTEANTIYWVRVEITDPNSVVTNYTMTQESHSGTEWRFNRSYTPLVAGTYSFAFWARDGSGNIGNLISSLTYSASVYIPPSSLGGGGSEIIITTMCGNRICEINENKESCAVDCAAKFMLLEPQFERELKKVILEGGLFGGNTYEFRIKTLVNEDLNMTFSTSTSWLKFDMGGSERSVFTSKLNRKGATDSGIGYIRLVAHPNATFSNTTLGEFQVSDGFTISAIPVVYVKSDAPDYSEYMTLTNVGIGLLTIVGLVFFMKGA